MHWFIAAGLGGVLFFGCVSRPAFGNAASSANGDSGPALLEPTAPLINRITFVGLRHIAPEAVQGQISSREGARLDLERIQSDVKALGRLSWFDGIEVEARPVQASSCSR